MSSAGVYVIRHQPAAVFREEYLPLMRELVGTQRLVNRQEEMYEMFARTLASRVSVGFLVCFLCDVFLRCFGFVLFLFRDSILKQICHKSLGVTFKQ